MLYSIIISGSGVSKRFLPHCFLATAAADGWTLVSRVSTYYFGKLLPPHYSDDTKDDARWWCAAEYLSIFVQRCLLPRLKS